MNKYKRVLSIDPGVTTGIALRVDENGSWITCVCKEWQEVCDLIKIDSLDQIVIENFAAENISKYGLITVRIVGGIQFVSRKYDIPLKIHNPQDRYPFRTQAKLMLEDRKHTVHEMDALSHLLRWEFDNGIQ